MNNRGNEIDRIRRDRMKKKLIEQLSNLYGTLISLSAIEEIAEKILRDSKIKNKDYGQMSENEKKIISYYVQGQFTKEASVKNGQNNVELPIATVKKICKKSLAVILSSLIIAGVTFIGYHGYISIKNQILYGDVSDAIVKILNEKDTGSILNRNSTYVTLDEEGNPIFDINYKGVANDIIKVARNGNLFDVVIRKIFDECIVYNTNERLIIMDNVIEAVRKAVQDKPEIPDDIKVKVDRQGFLYYLLGSGYDNPKDYDVLVAIIHYYENKLRYRGLDAEDRALIDDLLAEYEKSKTELYETNLDDLNDLANDSTYDKSSTYSALNAYSEDDYTLRSPDESSTYGVSNSYGKDDYTLQAPAESSTHSESNIYSEDDYTLQYPEYPDESQNDDYQMKVGGR